jgi:uncharacterized phage-associated protein
VLNEWVSRIRVKASFFGVNHKVDFSPKNHYLCVMHDSRAIANEFLKVAAAHANPLTPMQLLKLVYIAHGWSLGLYGAPLIADEIQAWEYGPVIPRLYNAIKDYRDQPVGRQIPTSDGEPMTDAERKLVRQVFELYGDKSGPALSRLTHAAGSPWALTYEPGSFGLRITNDVIEDHYQRLAEARK